MTAPFTVPEARAKCIEWREWDELRDVIIRDAKAAGIPVAHIARLMGLNRATVVKAVGRGV